MNSKTITVNLKQRQDENFDIEFDDGVEGSSSVHQLCAAVGIDLADSMLSTLRKVE